MNGSQKKLGTMDSASIVRSFYEAFGRGDMNECCTLMHPDCIIDEAGGLPFSGLFYGPQGFVDLVDKIAQHLTGLPTASHFANTQTGVVGQVAITLNSVATGREMEANLLEFYTVEQNRIVAMDVYYKDPAKVRELAEESATTLFGKFGLDHHGIIPAL